MTLRLFCNDPQVNAGVTYNPSMNYWHGATIPQVKICLYILQVQVTFVKHAALGKFDISFYPCFSPGNLHHAKYNIQSSYSMRKCMQKYNSSPFIKELNTMSRILPPQTGRVLIHIKDTRWICTIEGDSKPHFKKKIRSFYKSMYNIEYHNDSHTIPIIMSWVC